MKSRLSQLLRFAFVAVLVPVVGIATGCARVHTHRDDRVVVVEEGKKGGPPPWAPAHGYRRKVAYRYYYDREIYYNVDKGYWIWIEGGGWRAGRKLPNFITINPRADKFAIIDLEGDDPTPYHAEVTKVYPKSKTKAPNLARGDGGDRDPGNVDTGPGRGKGRGQGRGQSRGNAEGRGR